MAFKKHRVPPPLGKQWHACVFRSNVYFWENIRIGVLLRLLSGTLGQKLTEGQNSYFNCKNQALSAAVLAKLPRIAAPATTVVCLLAM